MAGCSTVPRDPAHDPAPPAEAVYGHDPHVAERSDALLHALTLVGVDYRYGGTSRATGFDCSALVAHVYASAWGVQLPRTAREQGQVGRSVPPSALLPGDLLFYNTRNRPYSHVGIYVGDGRFIHSPRAGSKVRVEDMRKAYWTRRFNGARRIDPVTASN